MSKKAIQLLGAYSALANEFNFKYGYMFQSSDHLIAYSPCKYKGENVKGKKKKLSRRRRKTKCHLK